MVADVESVTTQGDYGVTITLKAPNSAFLDYLACPYGPRMLSPEGLKKNAGTDNAQTYLTNHDLGTGPYTLTAAEVGSKYEMAAFADYWGAKPYFEKVELPVITDSSAQQLQFNNGQLAAILHDLPSSAVQSYLDNKSFANYSLPTMMSNYLYINPRKGMMTDVKNRNAVLQAIDVDELVKQTYFGRGEVAEPDLPVEHDGAGVREAGGDARPLGADRAGRRTACRPEDHHHRLRLQQPGQPVDQQPDSDAAGRGGPDGQGAGLSRRRRSTAGSAATGSPRRRSWPTSGGRTHRRRTPGATSPGMPTAA